MDDDDSDDYDDNTKMQLSNPSIQQLPVSTILNHHHFQSNAHAPLGRKPIGCRTENLLFSGVL